jgi:hypothetical protein
MLSQVELSAMASGEFFTGVGTTVQVFRVPTFIILISVLPSRFIVIAQAMSPDTHPSLLNRTQCLKLRKQMQHNFKAAYILL